MELIQSKRRDLEDRLTQQRKEHSWKEEMFVKMRLLSKAVADRHVCVYEGADSLYFSHEHGNYSSIRLFFNPRSFSLRVESGDSPDKCYQLSDEGCQETVLQEIDSAIKRSKEYFHKLRFWLWDITHTSS